MQIVDHPSPNWFASFEPIQAIVLHGTAGPLGASLATLTNPRVDNPDKAVSAHYVIDTSGVIYRLVSYWKGQRAWANGKINRPDKSLKWLAECVRYNLNPNLVTISIEHVATSSDMIHRGRMTDAQFAASQLLVKTLLRENKLEATAQTVVGHNQIDSVNKGYCPGVINVPAYINALNGIY
jgi:N-acetyl-anhydromuramyl-L-alanine amidase AmpD